MNLIIATKSEPKAIVPKWYLSNKPKPLETLFSDDY